MEEYNKMKYPKKIAKYQGSLEELAEDLGNLRYDVLAEFLGHLSLKLELDAAINKSSEKPLLSDNLSKISHNILEAKVRLETVWKMFCKKHMPKKDDSHIVMKNGGMLCSHCGAHELFMLPMPISDMTRTIDTFTESHEDCEPTWKEPEHESGWNIEKRISWWWENGHRGESSETMWKCLNGGSAFAINHPYDAGDFGRCYNLLEIVPEWKGQLDKLRELSVEWDNFIERWDVLTEMYEKNVRENWENAKEVGMNTFIRENCLKR